MADRSFSTLESIVRYLKESCHLSLHEIAVILNRDDSTIWTVYDRAKRKMIVKGQSIGASGVGVGSTGVGSKGEVSKEGMNKGDLSSGEGSTGEGSTGKGNRGERSRGK